MLTRFDVKVTNGDEPLALLLVSERPFEVPLRLLRLSIASSDREVRAAVAAWPGVPEFCIADCVVDRHDNGGLTVRPADRRT